MELTNLIFNILILVGIILMLYFQFYVPSYLKKKGENLATKEDIAQITKEIKEVETKFKVLNEQFSLHHERNPIENIRTRLKSIESITEKGMKVIQRLISIDQNQLKADASQHADFRVGRHHHHLAGGRFCDRGRGFQRRYGLCLYRL